MDDTKLLELAGLAAGEQYGPGNNPLEQNDLALRLAVKCRIYWYIGGQEIRCGDEHGSTSIIEAIGVDECASFRRAIVRAAAAIGGLK